MKIQSSHKNDKYSWGRTPRPLVLDPVDSPNISDQQIIEKRFKNETVHICTVSPNLNMGIQWQLISTSAWLAGTKPFHTFILQSSWPEVDMLNVVTEFPCLLGLVLYICNLFNSRISLYRVEGGNKLRRILNFSKYCRNKLSTILYSIYNCYQSSPGIVS